MLSKITHTTQNLKRKASGISAICVSGPSIEIAFNDSVIRIRIEGDKKRVWVDDELYSKGLNQVTKVVVAPERYNRSHFVEVNKIVIERYFTQEAALKEVAGKYGFVYENFRRQYYERGGNKIRPGAG
jgi:hypothetical protein